VAIICQPVISGIIKKTVMQAYKIPSGAMNPTILQGDYIVAKKGIFADLDSIKRGDIVIFPFPMDPSKDFIKRVIGLGGDLLEIKEKEVYINGESLIEPYKIHLDDNIISAERQPRDNYGPVKIPDDSLFVMGDNRDQSNDSRYWGVIKKASIKGKASSTYWSWDHTDHRIRWNRIGIVLNRYQIISRGRP
jgi:signal peptidase I